MRKLLRDLPKRRLTTLFTAAALVVLFNVALYSRDASADANGNYAVIREHSGQYLGIIGEIDNQNPTLGSGSLTNATLWVIDYQTCGGLAWVESGWSKRSSWGGQLRHKFMYKVAPNCVFTIWPQNLGSPAIGPFYEYRLLYNATPNAYQLFINGVYKAQINASFVFADRLDVGSELKPPDNVSIGMGPSHFQQLQYKPPSGNPVYFYYHDTKHCDIDPPANLTYNLIYPASSPHWIYTWGPQAPQYCGSGGP